MNFQNVYINIYYDSDSKNVFENGWTSVCMMHVGFKQTSIQILPLIAESCLVMLESSSFHELTLLTEL